MLLMLIKLHIYIRQVYGKKTIKWLKLEKAEIKNIFELLLPVLFFPKFAIKT